MLDRILPVFSDLLERVEIAVDELSHFVVGLLCQLMLVDGGRIIAGHYYFLVNFLNRILFPFNALGIALTALTENIKKDEGRANVPPGPADNVAALLLEYLLADVQSQAYSLRVDGLGVFQEAK